MATKTQICAWVEEPKPEAHLEIRKIEISEPGEGQVLVKLDATGVCHSDCHSVYGNTPMTTNIAGHEGVGRVVKLGSGVSSELMDARVGVSWLHKACGKCEICAVDECYCPHQENSGRNVPGTFQKYVVAQANFVSRIPDALSSEVAAPLLCGGVTMYGALVRAGLKSGDYILMPGAGGGLGHLGLQIASHFGYKVIAVDTGEQKRALCTKLGVEHFIDFGTTNVADEVRAITKMGVHAVICIAGAAAYDMAIPLLRNCGTLVCVGIPTTTYRLQVNPFEILVRGIKIIGSSVGSKQHMKELLQLAAEGKVVPHMEMAPFEDIDDVLMRLQNYKITGRVVLQIPDSETSI